MTVSSERTTLAPTESILTRAEGWLGVAAQRVGTLGVLTMLAAAAITVLDALARFALGVSFSGLNEVMSPLFAVAVAACIPVGLAARVNINVDILTHGFGPRRAAMLQGLGALALFAFFALLAFQFAAYAGSRLGQSSTILGIPQAPFMIAVGVVLAFAAVLQAVVLLNTLRAPADSAPTKSAVPSASPTAQISARIVLGLMALTGFAIVIALFDLPAVAAWAQRSPGWSVALICAILWLLLLGLMPIAAAMGLLGLAGAAVLIGPAPALLAFATEVSSFLTRSEVSVLPLYLLMGSFATVAGMSEDIYRLANVLFAPLRGGLAYATIGGCAGFGAITGSSIATAATFGKIALPQMRQHGYSDALATGCVAAGGTLGQLIPPSTALIVYALLTEASIGKLFIAAMVPGLIAVLFYFATIYAYVRVAPASAPMTETIRRTELWSALRQASGVLVLFIAVMGGLYSGVFTANESAAVGALGAFGFALARGKLRGAAFWRVMAETTATTAMIYSLIFGALMLTFYAGVSGLPGIAASWINSLTVAPWIILVGILVGYTLLGTAMDTFAIMLITTPVIAPLIVAMGYDLIWWGIIMLIVVETGEISPPFGMNLFVLRSVAPDVPLGTVFKGVLPFCVSDFIRLALLVAFPIITLWLPSQMFR